MILSNKSLNQVTAPKISPLAMLQVKGQLSIFNDNFIQWQKLSSNSNCLKVKEAQIFRLQVSNLSTWSIALIAFAFKCLRLKNFALSLRVMKILLFWRQCFFWRTRTWLLSNITDTKKVFTFVIFFTRRRQVEVGDYISYTIRISRWFLRHSSIVP